MTIREAVTGKEYMVDSVCTDDEEMDSFLFSLGCFSGEPITVISRKRGSLIIAVKDGRYNIDNQLADTITVV